MPESSTSGRSMLLRYRGGEGMLAWAFHRISGVAIWAFVVLHVIALYLVGVNPEAYDDLLAIYASPIGRILEALLGAALLYHALNGLRIIVMDFWPPLTHFLIVHVIYDPAEQDASWIAQVRWS
ncbi:MAG TPA: succinate dehydrogenase, cytochrome b556 subunit, partial [Candidatus Limnocylindrales bacterium]|nr:succinate dehydrogenase, cytochrome b556 subunit [Candidatus Limnocylindrales bacterium]